jgi:hypothetical protein
MATIAAMMTAPISPAVAAIHGSAETPTNADSDGMHDVINGNCRVDFADDVWHLNHL